MISSSRDFPAMHYGLVVGGHGMAWVPSSSDAKRAPYHSGYGERPLTRWFGGLTPDSQIEISSFAEGIRMAGLHMDYILFDDCFMFIGNMVVIQKLYQSLIFTLKIPDN